MSQHSITNSIEVTKRNPCNHCGKPDWCYRLGDDLSACKRGVEPATGWIKTGKVDTGGTALYGTVASQEAWLKKKGKGKWLQSKVEPKVVKTTKYRYEVFEPSSDSNILSHLGNVKPSYNFNEVIRTDFDNGTKQFKQCSKIDGETIWRVDPSLRPNVALYNTSSFLLQLLMFQSKSNEELSNETIFIVEGEKCVDTLSKIGITTFCSLGGSKWRESDTQWFLSLLKYHNGSERNDWKEHCPTIVLCPDIDKPGLEHLINVQKQLIDAHINPSRIKWFLPYPVGKLSEAPLSGGLDVADMLEENPDLTVDDFLSNLKTTKECHFLEANLIGLMDYIWGDVEDNSSPLTTSFELPFLSSLFNEVSVEIDWLIQDLLPSKSAVVLTGNPGVGKSVSMIDLAAAVASGGTWLGKECKQGKVLILNNDQSLDILLRYAKKRIKEDDLVTQNEVAVLDDWKADDDSLEQLSKWVEKYQFSLVIMDSVRACICHPLDIRPECTRYRLQAQRGSGYRN